jgi:hypothetical protein
MIELVTPVAPPLVHAAWPRVEALVQDGLSHSFGELTVDDVHRLVAMGAMQLHVVLEDTEVLAIAVTELTKYPRVNALRVVILAGKDSVQWGERMDSALTDFARRAGAERIEAMCRPGMLKGLKPFGYSQAYIVMLKPVYSIH